MRPEDAEFGVTIDFKRGESDPIQVFAAMTEMLSAFVEMDRQLIGAVAPNAEPMAVLEHVEAASITTWIKNRILKVDDQALKEFDWKQQLGVYAVKAKYRIVGYLEEREDKQRAERLLQLRSDLETLARDVSPQDGLLPPTIDLKALTGPMNQLQAAKTRLRNGETVVLHSDHAPDHQVNVQANTPMSTTSEEPIAPGTAGDMEMTLLIRKADLIGRSQWEFRHGKSTIRANIEDEDWLSRFHRGQERILPGSYMRATVSYRYDYTPAGDLADSEYDVSKVHGILPPNPQETAALFSDA